MEERIEEQVSPMQSDGAFVAPDGAIIDVETGEVLGYEHCPSSENLEDVVQWALKRRAMASAKAVGIKAEMDELINGIRDRLEAQIKEQERRIEYIDKFYGETLERYAEDKITGTKQKSVKLPFGTLGFRAFKGALKIEDPVSVAGQLMRNGFYAPIKVTLNLNEADDKTRAFALGLLTGGPNGSEQIQPFAAISVGASMVTPEMEAAVDGLERDAPKHPLGKFYVSH